MAGSASKSGDIFNLDRIRELVELMKQHDLREIDLKQDEQQIRLCRNVAEAAPRYAPPPPQPAAVAPQPTPQATTAAAEGKNIVTIKSPMVGTYYSKPNPNSDSFVKVGDRVSPDKTVCIVEAMKTFNEIPAEVSGTIVAILVDDGEFVDFDKPLFKVDTSK
jgi:acetyl-CoA carboxylase biotin carboxyl carrier protein